MIIGVPKEIKNNENRVGMTPSGVAEVVKQGHRVFIQHTAGVNSGFPDEAYQAVGAHVLPTIEDIYATAEMIVKVKEPIVTEYNLIRKGQLLFTYFHFASDKELTLAMLSNKSICLAYETVEEADHSLPLLIPMSEVAGRMSIQEGARFLEKPQGGKGILLGGVPGVKPAKVLILGGGVVKTLYSSELRIRKELPDVDLVVGSVLIPGDKAPHLITKEMLSIMQPGTVLVDVAIDQGGCFETSHPTTHSAPTYIVDGIVHYAVANIPGAVPYTSTLALTNATLPYVIALANKGWKKACKENPALALGLNIVEGKIVYKAVADVFGLKYDPISL